MTKKILGEHNFVDEILKLFRTPMNQAELLDKLSDYHENDIAEAFEELSEEERKKLINRLKRVEGQIRGIIGMLENDAYCNDILIQSAAVNAAVNAFNKELLASHIRNCVARDIRDAYNEIQNPLRLQEFLLAY